MGELRCDERRVDVVLGISEEQEAAESELAQPDLAQEDDRRIVHGPPIVSGVADAVVRRPDGTQADVVDGQDRTHPDGLEALSGRGEGAHQRVGGRPCPGSSRPQDPTDAVPLEEGGQAAEVVLVRVSHEDEVDPAIPGRDMGTERSQQVFGIARGVDQEASAARAFHEDGIALTDVEDDDMGPPVGVGGGRDDEDDERETDQEEGAPEATTVA